MVMAGIVERLQRAVGRLSERAERHRRPADYPYACIVCEVPYPFEHHVCPECGSYSVESRSGARLGLVGGGHGN